MTSLRNHPWRTSYSHESGDLIKLFYEPALSAAKEYDRLTGFFKASALAVAARGLDQLILNDGRMRLIVGCTLDPPEIEAIDRGYDMRQLVEEKLLREPLNITEEAERAPLECLAQLIYQGHLDIKIAIPVDDSRKPIHTQGIFHEKLGILTDAQGDRIVFHGSINESFTAWVTNRESFSVYCSWRGEDPADRVKEWLDHFTLYWEGKPRHTEVWDFPEALKQKLLKFLPNDPNRISPPPRPVAPPIPVPLKLLPEEKRLLTATFLALAPRFSQSIQLAAATSAVTPWPHQVRSYARFIQNWPSRLLVADEVGLGKTITAGLILRQAYLSGLAPRILLLAPKAVLTQWQNELREKFNLTVPIYDGNSAQLDADPLLLASSHLMRRKDRRQQLLNAQPWQLIILDEAHHARRKGAGSASQEGPNSLLTLMQALAPKSASLLLLTATPMQIAPVEVFDLCSLLGLPAQWARDPKSFDNYFAYATENPAGEKLEYLAQLFRACAEKFQPLTQPDLAQILKALNLPKPHQINVQKNLLSASSLDRKHLPASQRLALPVLLPAASPLRHLMIRNTRALLRAYRAAGKISSGIAERDPRDIAIPMSPAESSLYSAMETYIKRAYNQAENESGDRRNAIGFILTTYRRRLASSFWALRQTLLSRLSRLQVGEAAQFTAEDDLQDDLFINAEEGAEQPEPIDQPISLSEEAELKILLSQIQVDNDSKAVELNKQLSLAFADGFSSAIVFTQYTDTMEYICGRVANAFPQAQIATYSGKGGRLSTPGADYKDWPTYTKDQVKLRLKRGEIQILLCTDAAAEGLNLQTCGMLVNYDLPWNPMRIEQRIGRIDRIGQKYPTVRIVNFAYQGTVEEDVFFTVGQRINLFQGVVGKLQPILARLPRAIQDATLAGAGCDDTSRERFVAQLRDQEDQAREATFDIDAAAEYDLEAPELPQPPFSQDSLDAVLNEPGLLPPNWIINPADARSWYVQPPGNPQATRITTDPNVFEVSSQSIEFFSPGGKLYEAYLADFRDFKKLPIVTPESNPPGHAWIDFPDHQPGQPASPMFLMLAPGSDQLISVPHLDQLLSYLRRPSHPRPFPYPVYPGHTIRGIA